MNNPVRKRVARQKPVPGKLTGLRSAASGFSETYFSSPDGKITKPSRYLSVPMDKISKGAVLPKGAKQHGSSMMIPVPLKRNPAKAYKRWTGKKATNAAETRRLFGGK